MTPSMSQSVAPEPVRAVLYARSAFEPHPGPDSSVERQVSELRTFVDSMGWSNQGEYRDEGISGMTSTRPALGRLIQTCRDGQADVVVVTDTARLARNMVLFLTLVKKLRTMDVRVVFTEGPLVSALDVPLLTLLEQCANDRSIERGIAGLVESAPGIERGAAHLSPPSCWYLTALMPEEPLHSNAACSHGVTLVQPPLRQHPSSDNLPKESHMNQSSSPISSPAMSVALYARSGHSNTRIAHRDVAAQLKALHQWSKQKGWIVCSEFIDYAGPTVDRPGLTKLFQACRTRSIEMVLTTDSCRLYRKPGQLLSCLLELDSMGVKAGTVNQPSRRRRS